MQINGRELDEEKVDYIISRIKEKTELSTIDNLVVYEQLKVELSKNSKLIDSFVAGKKSSEKIIVKMMRDILRKMHGTFNNTSISKRKEIFENYLKDGTNKHIIELLKTHKSSQERLDIYENLYHNIFEITKNPTSILDLGCGLNPLSIIFMEDKKLNYFASDISESDLEIIGSFFKTQKELVGETKVLNLFDIKKKNIFSEFENFDMCFLFKVFDSIELSKNHKLSEIIMRNVPASWIIVSFPTKTVSGKKMNYPGRGWFEQMLGRLELFHRKLSYENEVFYIVKKIEEQIVDGSEKKSDKKTKKVGAESNDAESIEQDSSEQADENVI